ncbi:hypothetical protein Pcinc_009661 [Petrolisthes cinctipes]|uniref:PA domain-containing protein n=1 Tax=Petrolisthes cinctipes TaxID=88211 RepID=A0AAE1G6I3_PETCI|nr:hypothetical protein Pcinc_009661 [Petrolisthes cinctipes]
MAVCGLTRDSHRLPIPLLYSFSDEKPGLRNNVRIFEAGVKLLLNTIKKRDPVIMLVGKGDVVYAYFGRQEDFDLLESLGVQVAGRIVLARYGEIFRGNIAATAERLGAVGLVLYADPQQYAPLGEEAVYPNTVYMPPSGAADGTVFLDDGDPLTRFYPAINSAYRMPESEASLPTIPITPISYRDASQILRSVVIRMFLFGGE